MSSKINIFVDRNKETVPTDFSWQFGIGNDHAFQLLRTDVCEHIKLAQEELGFRYIRFHGIFCDDMLVYQRFSDLKNFRVLPHSDEIAEISFKQVSIVLDNVLKCGMKPFLELSFMPTALASGQKTGLRYKNNTTMPADMDKWCGFVRRFIVFLLERYGEKEVTSWYFEIWNEPDLPLFFDGNMQDYFSLYAATVKAIKAKNSNLRVGGPSTSACRWLKEFVAFCQANDVPYDFISTHHYPGDAFGNILADKDPLAMVNTANYCAENSIDMGDTMTALFYEPRLYKTWKKGAFIEFDRFAKEVAGDKPLFISEWNSMAVYAAPIHDEKYSAAFVVKSVMDAQWMTDGLMFWCCSDIFEEMFDLGKPFHGSFGIVNNDGIPKPNFWAFKLLSRLFPNRIDLPTTNEDVEYSVFTEGDKTQILLYAQDFDPEKNEEYEIEITINTKANKVTKQAIDDVYCNPKSRWLKMGKPDVLTRVQVSEIKEKTALINQAVLFETKEGFTIIRLVMRTNDIALLTLE